MKTAADRGIPVFVGGMLESGVGRAAALAVAALPGCTGASDLGPSTRYFDPDLTEPFELTADGASPYRPVPASVSAPISTGWRRPPSRCSSSRHERTCGLGVDRQVGSAAAFHQRALPDPVRRAVWWFEVERPALVLGSAQADAVVDRAAASAAGVDVVRRRSGGGAVLLTPGDVTWLDVVIPSDDRLWDDDVGRAFHWLGEAWAAALAAVGISSVAVHRGALRRGPWSDLVCFAGLGPGEVMVAGRKASACPSDGAGRVPASSARCCTAGSPTGSSPCWRCRGASEPWPAPTWPAPPARSIPPAPTSRRRSWPRCRSERRALDGYRRFALMVHC